VKNEPTADPATGEKLRLTRYERDESPLLIFPRSSEETQDRAPICWQSVHGGYWAVRGYREAREVLASASHFSSRQTLLEALIFREAPIGPAIVSRNLDPPLHGEYRRLLGRLMASGARRAGRLLAQTVVAEVLQPSNLKDTTDFNETFAVPVAAKVLFRFIGLPRDEESEFVELAQLFARSRYLDGSPGAPVSSRIRSLSETEPSWMNAYIRRRITSGLIGVLISMDWRAHFTSREDEAAEIFFDFIQAGLTQIPTVLRNAIRHLVANRNDRQALLANPGLAPRMVDELLRLYPISFPARIVRRDIVVANTELHVGEVVLPFIRSANRDASVFHQPHRVLLDRANPREHLSFGAGPHYCLGAALTHDILTESLASADRIIRNYQLLAA
jgi:cytochrome P450